jgi:FlaA1/EpsC-like NDP-sugar epimerase
MLLDLLLICLALMAAYLWRYEGVLEKRFVEQFVQVLPLIVIFKLPLLYRFGVYRGMWRYTGARDVSAILKAGTLGSLLAAVAIFLIYRADGLNRSVLFLDWGLFIALLVGTRLSFVFMRDWLGQLRRQDLTNVLIVGANDSGELMLRALNRSRGRAYRAVGFLDDDPTKRHLSIHGVPVVGYAAELEAVARRLGADEVLVAIGSPAARARVLERCRRAGLPVREVGQFFDDQLAGEPAVRPIARPGSAPASPAASGPGGPAAPRAVEPQTRRPSGEPPAVSAV